MKKLVFALFSVLCAFGAHAQLVVAEQMYHDTGSIEANRANDLDPIVVDGDTVPFAIVRVGLVVPDVEFDSKWLLKQEFKDNEYYLYFMDGVKSMTVRPKPYTPLHYKFPEPLKAKNLYRMTLHKPADDKSFGTLHVTSNVKNAEVYLDGSKVSDGVPYEYKGESGKHVLELRAPGYAAQKREVNVPMGQVASVNVPLFDEGSLDVDGVSYGMVPVDAVSFTMGGDLNYYTRPAHSVKLRPFKFGSTPVSFDLWVKVMGETDDSKKGPKGEVVNVTYDECLDFISALNDRTGGSYRLPTEAEWEYVAGHGTTVGVSDIRNIMEWCSDWFGKYNIAFDTNPVGPDSGVQRVVRGGSDYPELNTDFRDISYRWHQDPEKASPKVSFRLVSD